jgi:hypothetical protein
MTVIVVDVTVCAVETPVTVKVVVVAENCVKVDVAVVVVVAAPLTTCK